MKIISLGAGVQSTTLYLMSCAGEIERADLAIFADTGWEPKAVYEHLERLKDGDIPITVVSKGNLRNDALDTSRRIFASMPLFTKDPETHKVAMLRRQCTREYKVEVLQKEMRRLGATAQHPFEVWIGISVDEAHRMKDSYRKYTYHRWPLIELRMSRADCRAWLENHGWDVPKSSCIGCPFHDDTYWSKLKAYSPDEFQDAVDFDIAIRDMPKIKDKVYLHKSATPLNTAVLDGSQQLDLFGNECEGMCGV